MENKIKKYIPSQIIKIPSFVMDSNNILKRKRNYIYSISERKKTALICTDDFKNQIYLSYKDINYLYKLIGGHNRESNR